MWKCAYSVLLVAAGSLAAVGTARADVIYLTADRYRAVTSATILTPERDPVKTWSSGPQSGSLFGEGGANALSLHSEGEVRDEQHGRVAATTFASLGALNNGPGTSGFRLSASGDGEGWFRFDTHVDSYLAFVVAGRTTSLDLYAERTGPHAASGYRLVDFTTGTTLLDRMMVGPFPPPFSIDNWIAKNTILLEDHHAYGLWTSAAVLSQSDPFAMLEFSTNADIVPTPEPASLLLFGSTALAAIYRRRRRSMDATRLL